MTVQDVLDAYGNRYCYEHVQHSLTDCSEIEDLPDCPPSHFPDTPCCLVVVNQHEFADGIATAVNRLRSDGLTVATSGLLSPRISSVLPKHSDQN